MTPLLPLSTPAALYRGLRVRRGNVPGCPRYIDEEDETS